jgi:hypothetical protein
MARILISGIAGLITYLLFDDHKSDNKIGQSKGEQAPLVSKSGGARKKVEKVDEQYPLCYEICSIAKKVYNKLKDKQETQEFKDIARLYSRIFCLEIALGNNPNEKVEENKINKELERYKNYYNLNDVENVEKFINDTFNKTDKLIKNISSNNTLIKNNNEIKEMHAEVILKLLNKFLKK